MPTLNWIGKEAVVNHHQQVPFRLLKDVPDLACGDPGSGNLIVQGDNLEALKALLPYYAGQVKCIYIDPPYNTGNEGWAYNDNVNSPLIRDWLGKTVGKEGETLDRHDRWLCMMYPRLQTLKKFLAEDGIIFVSIDDIEISYLRTIMDEIFGSNRFIAQLIWKSRQNKDNRNINNVSVDHEYILCYGAKLKGATRDAKGYSNPDGDKRGSWTSANMVGLATESERPNLHYDLINPNTSINYGKPMKGWRYDKKTMKRLIDEKRILWPVSPKGRPRKKQFLSDLLEEFTGFSSFVGADCYTSDGTKELVSIFGDAFFAFPKNSRLIKALVEQINDKDAIILDSFAGSGTTAHAVLKLNAEDGGTRRFILVEMEAAIARAVTAERVRRVAQGYKNAKGEEVDGLGGGFRYCELGEPLFDETGMIRETVKFSELARHVYFSETGEPLPRARVLNTPLLGVCRGVGIYLLYNGILGDQSANGGNVLTRQTFAKLPPFDGPKVIYCAGCLLSRERLQNAGITVRQTPYEIKVS